MKNPMTSLYKRPLIANKFFHVYNRTNNKELLFKSVKDHHNFLEYLKLIIRPFTNIMAYNLMSNHFHLLIQTIAKDEMMRRFSPTFIEKLPPECKALVLADEDNVAEILSNRFQAVFNSYAQSFNYHNDRKGNVFHKSFCKKMISSELYLKQCMYYINNNGVKHGICQNFDDQPWSSFNAFKEQNEYLLNVDRISDLYDGRDKMISYHNQQHIFEKEYYFRIEEEDLLNENLLAA